MYSNPYPETQMTYPCDGCGSEAATHDYNKYGVTLYLCDDCYKQYNQEDGQE